MFKTPRVLFLLFVSSFLVACGGGGGSGNGGGDGGTNPPPTGSIAEVVVDSDSRGIMAGDYYALTITLSETVKNNASVVVRIMQQNTGEQLEQKTAQVNTGQRQVTVRWIAPQPDTDTYASSATLAATASYNGSQAESNNFLVYKAPPAELLANSQGKHWQTQAQADLVVTEGSFAALNSDFDAWPLPEDPMWNENPYNDTAWQRDYHSLGWLYAYDYAFAQSGDPATIETLKSYLFDYIEDAPIDANNEAALDDLAVAWRLEAFAYFYHKYFRSELSQAESEAYVEAMQEHAEILDGYGFEYIYTGEHNALYHAVALMNLGVVLPGINSLEKYTGNGAQSILYLYDVLVAEESGATKEQSTAALLEALELFSLANGLNRVTHDRDIVSFSERLKALYDFSAHLVYGEGRAPAMGRTPYGQTNLSERVSSARETGGIEAIDGPLLTNYAALEHGYVIQRPSNEANGDELYTFTDYGKRQELKGHHDAGNIVAAYAGQPLLIDSGGQLQTGAPLDDYFSSTFAHNILTVQDKATLRGIAKVSAAGCDQGLCYSIGELGSAEHMYYRLVFSQVSEHGPRWTIVDIADSVYVDTELDFKLMFHFAPDATVTAQADAEQCQQITLANGAEFCLQTQADLAQSVHYFHGEDSEQYTQGWVQTETGAPVAAPVIEMRSRGMALIAVTELRSAAQQDLPLATVTRVTDDTWDHTIDLGSYVVDVLNLTSFNAQVQVTKRNP